MILYNVTVGIDKDVEEDWLHWMRQTHIPEVMATGKFLHYKIFKVLGHEEGENTSYSIQYFADAIENVVDYLNNDAPALVEAHRQKYKDKHVAFRTLLEELY